MTSRADQIQSMIADIDKLLTHKGKRLWGVISSQEEPRQVLQRIRDFLVNETDKQTSTPAQLPPLVAKFVEEGNQDFEESQQPKSSDNQLSELIEPLKAELKVLLEERANLVSEIRELETKRLHDYSLAQQLASQEKIISEFMEVLRNRLSDDIDSGGFAASSGNISENITGEKALKASGDGVNSSRLERLTHLTNNLDQRLVALDGTVNVVFEALQRNIYAYHDSLSEALVRMHHKGVQGEQLLQRLVKNFAQLSQQQVSSELLQQITDEVTVESIDSESVEQASAYNQANNEKLEVTLDETIDNIEFSQAQEDADDTSITSDLSAIFSQIDEEADRQELTEKLQEDNYLEVQFPETEEEIVEEEIVEDSDAFDSPERMQAVLSELKKSTSTEEELPADTSSESANEDEVDQLYASLLDSDNLTTSNPQSNEQEIHPSGIDVEIPITLDFDSQVREKQVKKEVVSQDVAFEFTPPSSNAETKESPTDEQLSLTDPWFNPSDIDLANSRESTNNLTTAKTSYRKIQPGSEDTITSLTEILFDEDSSQEVVTPPTENSELEEDVAAVTNEEIAQPIQQQHIATSTEQEIAQPIQQQQQIAASTEQEIAQPIQQQQIAASTEQEIAQPIQQQQQIAASTEQEIAQPIQQQQIAASTEQEIAKQELQLPKQSESLIEPTEEKPQLQQITLPFISRQPNTNLDASSKLNPLPTTKKTIATSEEENSSEDNLRAVNTNEIPSSNNGDTVWYLGLDLGTTGISGALLNRSTCEIHPIYWTQENQSQATSQTHNFRLPAEVYLPKTSISEDKNENSAEQNIYSAYLKPYLQISLPYKNISQTANTEVHQKWEPILQLNEFSKIPLVWIVRSLSKLLLTLKSESNSTTLGLTATAIGIPQEEFNSIINNIAGIICTCPSNWSEQYRFNIRESLLISQLIEHPQQVFFVEEAIATLLRELEGANGEIVQLVHNENSPPVVISESNLIGNTLVINIGASATEMLLVDLPENLQDLTHNEFMLHGFTCGGKAMEQDIITQLLLPPKWRKSRNSQSSDTVDDNNPLHWKPNIPGLEQIRFSSLGLEHLELPRAGEPDISERIRLQQRLESSPLGKALLDAAIALKLILQHQESFTIELADQRWELQRRDLESQVFVPFVRRINRELNKLLVARGIPTEAINQIILSGGVSSITAINRWLHQKLPSARIIQEKYLGENGTPACSRVATGLSVLPLHPLVLEIPRQQYTDYFLFTELLRLIPEKTLSFGEVIQLFEGRGINTRTCQQRLLAFLEGEIPPGLIPNKQDMQWLNQSSVENSNYKAISASPLFDKQGSLSYRPNLRQLEYLRNYLEAIKASAHQSLEEPYIVNFALGVTD